MLVIPYKGKYPTIGRGCYIAPTATLIGDDLMAHRERFPAMLDADAFELADRQPPG